MYTISKQCLRAGALAAASPCPKLRVNDNAVDDTGYINSWSVTF